MWPGDRLAANDKRGELPDVAWPAATPFGLRSILARLLLCQRRQSVPEYSARVIHRAFSHRASIGGMGRALDGLAHRQMLEYYVRPWRTPGRLCTRRKSFGRLPARSSATRVSGGFRWALCSNNAR